MNHECGIQETIRSFILEKFPAARRKGLTDNTPLLESGIIDSLGVLDVVAFLEPKFGMKIEDEELVPGNFRNVHSLTNFVEQKTRPRATAG